MYQLTKPINEVAPSQAIKRLSDNAFIPFDNQNTDYVAYLAWVSEGNSPLPADQPEQS
jgi:hypothetical protein